ALGPMYEVGESSSAAAARPAGEARMSREAWVRATDASDLVHGDVISLRTTVLGQISEIRELQAADCRRQTVISELPRIDHRRSIENSESRTALQGQITALHGEVTALQAQDQPLPADASPTALSPGYIVDSDPERDEKDPKEDPADYPADRGNNDEDKLSNDEDDDDDVKKDEEDKEEEEHLTSANPSDISTDDLVPSS
nr:hypothetical protein [Tanacetum cinerariifolium]